MVFSFYPVICLETANNPENTCMPGWRTLVSGVAAFSSYENEGSETDFPHRSTSTVNLTVVVAS